MKEVKFQKNACIIMAIASIIISAIFAFDTISNGFNWLSLVAVLYLLVSTLERYSKYKLAKMKYFKNVEN